MPVIFTSSPFPDRPRKKTAAEVVQIRQDGEAAYHERAADPNALLAYLRALRPTVDSVNQNRQAIVAAGNPARVLRTIGA